MQWIKLPQLPGNENKPLAGRNFHNVSLFLDINRGKIYQEGPGNPFGIVHVGAASHSVVTKILKGRYSVSLASFNPL